MAKKDKKKGAAEKKARVAEKSARKSAKKETKASKKGGPAVVEDDDQDIDAVLEEYRAKQALFMKVTESALSEPPPVRSGATLTPSPASSSELFLFGGETFNGSIAHYFNDLHVFSTSSSGWRSITSPNSPLPRSGHWVTATAHAGGTLWLFGGECSSPKMASFYHYNDFWTLSCSSREWSRVETKKGPPARSGHRIIGWKHLVVLFGGFQDTSQSTKYLNDLWVFDVNEYTWTQITLPTHAQRPDARSSFSMLPHEHGLVIYGGYSKKKSKSTPSGKKGKQAATEVGHIHEDSWLLKLDADLSKVRWERRKKPGNPPNPRRVGVTMASHKGRGIMFGGVFDREETDEELNSEFFNGLFAWGVDRNRFFPLVLRKPRAQQKRVVEARGGRRDRAKEGEEELLRNLAMLEGKSADDIKAEEDEMKKEEEKAKSTIMQQDLSLSLPSPRFHCALAVQDDVLYIYGGTVEKDDREVAFDDMYAIDLVKLDGVRTIFSRRDETAWVESDSEDDEDEDEDEEDEDDSEDSDAETEITMPSVISAEEIEARRREKAARRADPEPHPEDPDDLPEAVDTTPSPRPFENLREFFTRTATDWLNILIKRQDEAYVLGHGKIEPKTVKELRGDAFDMAEEKWWASREEIRALEDEQEEAGIGEVVALDPTAAPAGGAGRRR